MKKMMMLGLIWLTLSCGQPVVAQDPATQGDSVAPVPATARLHIRYKKKGEPALDWTYTSLDVTVNYDEKSRIWLIVGAALRRGHRGSLTVKYDESTKVLTITGLISQRGRGDAEWRLVENPKVKITVGENSSFLRLDFLNSIEATNRAGEHCNIMQRSWLLAPR